MEKENITSISIRVDEYSQIDEIADNFTCFQRPDEVCEIILDAIILEDEEVKKTLSKILKIDDFPILPTDSYIHFWK